MADLEERAFRRDKRFLVRLLLGLAAGTLAGLLLFAKMTSTETKDCAASMFGPKPEAAPTP